MESYQSDRHVPRVRFLFAKSLELLGYLHLRREWARWANRRINQSGCRQLNLVTGGWEPANRANRVRSRELVKAHDTVHLHSNCLSSTSARSWKHAISIHPMVQNSPEKLWTCMHARADLTWRKQRKQ